jgi:hypothetical protein
VKLSGEEYDRRIIALHRDLPPAPSKEQRQQVRRSELELAIDYRLGTDFPRERRDALWAVHERVERRRGWLLVRHLIRRIFPGTLERRVDRLAGYLTSEYAKVLSPEELELFLGHIDER